MASDPKEMPRPEERLNVVDSNASCRVKLSTEDCLVDGLIDEYCTIKDDEPNQSVRYDDDSEVCPTISQEKLIEIESRNQLCQEPEYCLPTKSVNMRNWLLIGAKDRRERAGPDLRADKSLRATTKPNGVIKSKAKTKYKSLGST